MGLTTENYVSKSTGITLPVAYAVLTNLIVETDNRARAIFAIQSSREATKQFKAIDKVEVHFTWDRKTDPAKQAYETAKTEVKTVEKYNEKGEPYTEVEYGTLYGWEDDIV
jgi:hypothetical protein